MSLQRWRRGDVFLHLKPLPGVCDRRAGARLPDTRGGGILNLEGEVSALRMQRHAFAPAATFVAVDGQMHWPLLTVPPAHEILTGVLPWQR